MTTQSVVGSNYFILMKDDCVYKVYFLKHKSYALECLKKCLCENVFGHSVKAPIVYNGTEYINLNFTY